MSTTVNESQKQAEAVPGWWSVNGRINRGKFFERLFLSSVVSIVGSWLLFNSGRGMGVVLIPILVLVYLLALLQGIKRSHDFGITGWSVVLALFPYIQIAWLLVLLIVPGKETENRYGAAPVTPPLPNEKDTPAQRAQDIARLTAMMKDNLK